MTYVLLDSSGLIKAAADWPFPGSIKAEEEVLRKSNGMLVFESDYNESEELLIQEKIAKAKFEAEQRKKEEQNIIPDLVDAVIELGSIIGQSTSVNSEDVSDIKDAIKNIEQRLSNLEGNANG